MADNLPVHIGFIMDGNGRWATRRGLERSQGHIAGAEAFRRICDYGVEKGIKYMTFYAFSTENWRRPPQEVSAIMDLFRQYLSEAQERKEENLRKGISMRFMGRRDEVAQDILDLFDIAQAESADAHRSVVNIAINYGGRDEITNAVRSLAADAAKGLVDPDAIDEKLISSRLYTGGQPDPDIIVRPSGEMRLSNFMIWQSAYSEFYFTDKLWPDFQPSDLDEIVEAFQARHRRFGGV